MPRTVIARWESKRAKDWVQVYEQSFSDGVAGYGYDTSNGGGWMGPIPRELALERVQQKVDQGCYCSQKSPMRKVV
jgi:hypothetical protein